MLLWIDHVCMTFGSGLNRFGIFLGSFWDRFRIILGKPGPQPGGQAALPGNPSPSVGGGGGVRGDHQESDANP